MKNPFKVGDLVVCEDASRSVITKGKHYLVTKIHGEFIFAKWDNKSDGTKAYGGMLAERFRLLGEHKPIENLNFEEPDLTPPTREQFEAKIRVLEKRLAASEKALALKTEELAAEFTKTAHVIPKGEMGDLW